MEGPEYGDVDVPAADHGEGFGAVEGGGAGHDGYGFFAGVDEVTILDVSKASLEIGRRRTHRFHLLWGMVPIT